MTPGRKLYNKTADPAAQSWMYLTQETRDEWEKLAVEATNVRTPGYQLYLDRLEKYKPDEWIKFSADSRRAWEAQASAEKDHDIVAKPDHYMHPTGVECRHVVETYTYHVGTAMAYLWRSPTKHDDPRQDIRKAIKHLEFELERLDAG